jgi:hypothetical protein
MFVGAKRTGDDLIDVMCNESEYFMGKQVFNLSLN